MAESALLQQARTDACDQLVEQLAATSALLQDGLERNDAAALDALRSRFECARDTLRVLGLSAASLLAADAARVVGARREGSLVARPDVAPGDVAKALLGAHALLLDALERNSARKTSGDADGALTVLTVLNDLRSLLGDGFVSAALLLALDIPVPSAPVGVDAPPAPAFIPPVKAMRPRLMRALVDWFRAINAQRLDDARAATGRLADELERLLADAASEQIDAGERDLLRCAGGVARALSDGRLADDGAVRRLFAQLERWLMQRWIDPPRGDAATRPGSATPVAIDAAALLRNLLFYLSLREPAAGVAGDAATEQLVERYGLARVRACAERAARLVAGADATDAGGTALTRVRLGGGVTTARALRRDVVHRVREELTALKDWLAQGGIALGSGDPGRRPRDRSIAARLARLHDLEPVLQLLGAMRSRERLQAVLATVSELAADGRTSPSARSPGDALAHGGARSAAEAILRLDDELDAFLRLAPEPPRDAVAGAAPHAPGALATRLSRFAVDEGRVDESGTMHRQAVDELTVDALQRLRRVESDIETWLSGSDDVGDARGIVAALKRIATALSIVPRPEISALLHRLADIVSGMPPNAGDRAREPLAGFAVAIEDCLSRAERSSADEAASLDAADLALATLEAALPARALGVLARQQADARSVATSGATPSSRSNDPMVGATVTVQALDALDAIGAALADASPDADELAHRFDALRRLARSASHADLERLATAASRRALRTPLAPPDLVALVDARDALPQLIEGLEMPDAGSGARPERFESLVSTLESGAPDRLDDTEPDAFDGTLRQVFLDECDVLLDRIEIELERAADPSDAPSAGVSEALLRALHTLLGSARTAHASSLADVAAPAQAHAGACRAQGDALPASSRAVLGRALGAMRSRREALATGAAPPPMPPGLLAELESPPEGPVRSPSPMSSRSVARDAVALDAATPDTSLEAIFAEEAQALLDRLDAAVHEPDTARALTVLHTLKGSARVVGQRRLAELAHAAEDRIGSAVGDAARADAVRDARRALSIELATPSARPGSVAAPVPDASTSSSSTLSPATSPATSPIASPIASPAAYEAADDAFARVRERDWQRLSGLSHDIAASQARLALEFERLEAAGLELERAAQRWRRLPAAASLTETAAARELLLDLSSVRRELRDALRAVDLEQRRGARSGLALQQDMVRARLQRFDGARPRLERALQDAADAAGRSVVLVVDGGGTQIDASLQGELLPAIEHLIRNAVVHGIEPDDERRAANKPVPGTVTVDCSIEGNRLRIDVRDDGRGVKRAAFGDALGADERSLAALLERMCAIGASSSDRVDAVSGRGLGLAAVQERVQQMRGRLRLVKSDADGTVFELRVPLRTPVQPVVLVDDGGLLALPVGAIAGIEPAGTGHHAPPLRRLLAPASASWDSLHPSPRWAGGAHDGHRSDGTSGGPYRIALAPSGASGAVEAVEVDRVLGYRELVVQPLDPQLATLGAYDGVASLPDGRRVLVLDPLALPSADDVNGGQDRGPRGVRKPRALVADDSPTQRAWTHDALTSLGFDVQLAHDGQQALEALEAGVPDVLLLDIDMPRIDGYGVLRAIAGESRPPCPVIVLTTRSSSRDRAAVRSFGATGFIAKPATRDALRGSLLAAGLPIAMA